MSKKHKNGFVKQALIDAEQKGMTVNEVALVYGIKPKTIHDLCQRYGIKLKRSAMRFSDYGSILKEFQDAEDKYVKLVSLAVENSWEGTPEKSPSNLHIRTARIMAEDAANRLRAAAKNIGTKDLILATEHTLGKNGF